MARLALPKFQHLRHYFNNRFWAALYDQRSNHPAFSIRILFFCVGSFTSRNPLHFFQSSLFIIGSGSSQLDLCICMISPREKRVRAEMISSFLLCLSDSMTQNPSARVEPSKIRWSKLHLLFWIQNHYILFSFLVSSFGPVYMCKP